MARADRASQFAPFAALKGYEEALRAKERIIVPKSELSPEMLEYLDYKFTQLKEGMVITVIYYEKDSYVKKTGILSRINRQARYITVVTTDIFLDDIKDIAF